MSPTLSYNDTDDVAAILLLKAGDRTTLEASTFLDCRWPLSVSRSPVMLKYLYLLVRCCTNLCENMEKTSDESTRNYVSPRNTEQ